MHRNAFSRPAALSTALAFTLLAAPAWAHGPAATPRPAAAQAGETHAHQGPHGGEVRSVGKHHVEVAVHAEDGMFVVYVLDAAMKPLPVTGKGQAVVQIAGKAKQTFPLVAMTDHYMGLVTLGGAKRLDALVSVPVAGKVQTVRFVITPRNMHH